MGTHKLLLPWQRQTVIDHVLDAWQASCVDKVVIVCRKDDHELAATIKRHPVDLVQPETAPVDMKASVLCGLHSLIDSQNPQPTDRCFVAPSDLPTLQTQVIDAVAAAATDPAHVVVPRFAGKSSHPVLFPISVMYQIIKIPPDRGLNHLVDSVEKVFVDLPGEQACPDIDTPQEYRALRDQH
ncbi:MAG: hypothetical protein CBB71_08145 [Rhodopirellula sp. TMED11]|nr:MAG: hypothetical protein CBB71_08145 [Rhodopirellula sp. TMED11]